MALAFTEALTSDLKNLENKLNEDEKNITNSWEMNIIKQDMLNDIAHNRHIIENLYDLMKTSKDNDYASVEDILKGHDHKKISYLLKIPCGLIGTAAIIESCHSFIESIENVKEDPVAPAALSGMYLGILIFSIFGIFACKNERQKEKVNSQNIRSALKSIEALYKCYGIHPKQTITFETPNTTQKPRPTTRALKA